MRYEVKTLWNTRRWPYDKLVLIFSHESDDDGHSYMLARLKKGDMVFPDVWQGLMA
jgi:predicted transglutaminase-like cysteine proteinase